MNEKLLKAPRKGCPVGFPGPTACSVCVPWTCPTLPTVPWLWGLRPPVSPRCSPEPHWLRPGCPGSGEGPGLLPGGEALWESFLNPSHSILVKTQLDSQGHWHHSAGGALGGALLVMSTWGAVPTVQLRGAQEIQEYLVEDSDKEAEMGQS